MAAWSASSGSGLWLVITLFPLYWIALTSIKSPGTINRFPIEYWPSEPSLENYISLFQQERRSGSFLGNCLSWRSIAGAVATLIALLSAYVIARFEFRGKGAVLIAFLLTQMIPAFIALGPLYSMMTDLGLVDTKPGLILVYIAVCIPFSHRHAAGLLRERARRARGGGDDRRLLPVRRAVPGARAGA